MKVTLTIFGEPSGRRTTSLLRPGEYTLGRAKDADVCIQNNLIAPRHCVLRVSEDGMWLHDLGEGRTELNGQTLKPAADGQAEVAVPAGAEVELASAVSILINSAELTEADKLELGILEALDTLRQATAQLEAALARQPDHMKLQRLIMTLAQAQAEFKSSGQAAVPPSAPAAARVNVTAPAASTVSDTPPGEEERDPILSQALRGGRLPGIDNIRVLGVLARGRVATILEGEMIGSGESVAIKLIDASNVRTKKVERFIQEGKILSKLEHPGLAQLLSVGAIQTPQGPRPYHVLELVRGLPLMQYADDLQLGTAERLELIAKILDTLQYVHAQGIVHRGLKPSNILVDAEGRPRLLDFGMARVGQGDQNLTTRGKIVGVLSYLSPEQTYSETDINERADIYAVGGIGYHLLAGKPPIEVSGRSLADSLKMIKEDVPQPLGAINEKWAGEIERIFARALEKDRAYRYANAGEMAEDLRRCVAAMGSSDDNGAGSIESAPEPVSVIAEDSPDNSGARILVKPQARFPSARPAERENAGIPQLPEFQIRSTLARGRVATIYEAEHVGLRKKFALKVYQPVGKTDEALLRFEKEGGVLRGLDHPGIVKFIKSGVYKADRGETPYHVMELVTGRPMLVYTDSKRLDVAGRLDLLIKLGDAVQYMHERGVIHRDLKPGNILVDDSGQPKILDFGIARFMEMNETLTAPGQILGNLSYISPEQLTMRSSDLDGRVDVYALGGIGYTLLTGQTPVPFVGRDIGQALQAILNTPPRPLGDFDISFRGPLETIFMKALAKNRDERYQTAGEFIHEVRRFRSNIKSGARLGSAFI